MKQLIFDFLFGGEADTSPSPKGLKADSSFKPLLRDKKIFSPLPPYHLERSNRKTIGFVINEHGLTVRAPRWVRLEDIEILIHERREWIQKKRDRLTQWQDQMKASRIEFKEGARIPYLGKDLTIHLDAQSHQVSMRGDLLIVNLPSDADSSRIKDLTQVWFKNEAKRYLGTRLESLALQAGVRFNRWGVSSAKGRWGSCSSNRTIRLNWMLIHLEKELIDYVISHELAHLDEMNHSPRFWARVGQICPTFQQDRNRLKGIYISQLPF